MPARKIAVAIKNSTIISGRLYRWPLIERTSGYRKIVPLSFSIFTTAQSMLEYQIPICFPVGDRIKEPSSTNALCSTSNRLYFLCLTILIQDPIVIDESVSSKWYKSLGSGFKKIPDHKILFEWKSRNWSANQSSFPVL